MTRVDGSLARKLDFGEISPTGGAGVASGRRGLLRLAPALRLSGPDKYKLLEARRRRAQIAARRLLDLLEKEAHGTGEAGEER